MKKVIHTYESLESSVDVMDDGEIQIDLSDCAYTSLSMSVEPEHARKIYEALKTVFDSATSRMRGSYRRENYEIKSV
jgi:hypothetical protein